MKTLSLSDFDEFPLSPHGSVNSIEFYESYLQSKKLAKGIPKNELGEDHNRTFYNLLQEVHSARTANPVLFRARVVADQALTMLWLSRVRATAQLFVALNEMPPFSGLTPDDMSKLSKLSKDVSNLSNLSEILLGYGIVLIYERAIPGIKLDGAVFNLSPERPVIALSLRYARLDNFWFTLMHELAHVALHHAMLNVPILDNMDEASDDIFEQQADRLASNSLVSRNNWRSCNAMYSQNEDEIYEFAEKMGVHPSIIAGRLQKELNRYDKFSEIVNAVNVRKVLLNNE